MTLPHLTRRVLTFLFAAAAVVIAALLILWCVVELGTLAGVVNETR